MKLNAETIIHTDLDTLWEYTGNPQKHVRWDLRFTDIEPLNTSTSDNFQRFKYVTRIGAGMEISGWGESRGGPKSRGTALRFGSEDPRSLIEEGSGCWVFSPGESTIHMKTVYDYRVRMGIFGRIIDRMLFRPLMLWGTRWSFDRLRIWIEKKIEPDVQMRLWLVKLVARIALGLVWITQGLLPKILLVNPREVDLVFQSGMYLISPLFTVMALGTAEIFLGLILVTGWHERFTVVAATVSMIMLSSLAVWLDPMALSDPYGGLIQHLCLFATALVVWQLALFTPDAGRATEK